MKLTFSLTMHQCRAESSGDLVGVPAVCATALLLIKFPQTYIGLISIGGNENQMIENRIEEEKIYI
jgi:hypothetical protein